MTEKYDLNIKFYQPILKAFAIIVGGFLLAPTQILLSIYQAHPLLKSASIFLGFFIVICALVNMILIAIGVISGFVLDRKAASYEGANGRET
jgi:hypothetical protein